MARQDRRGPFPQALIINTFAAAGLKPADKEIAFRPLRNRWWFAYLKSVSLSVINGQLRYLFAYVSAAYGGARMVIDQARINSFFYRPTVWTISCRQEPAELSFESFPAWIRENEIAQQKGQYIRTNGSTGNATNAERPPFIKRLLLPCYGTIHLYHWGNNNKEIKVNSISAS